MKRSVFGGILLLAVSTAGCGRVAGLPGSMNGQTLNEAQKFTLKTPEGGMLSLAQALSQNKSVLVNFWATWCSYCVEEMPDLVQLQEKYAKQGFTVIAVNAGESGKQAAAFVKKHRLNFPVALDEDMAVSQAYGLVGIPTTFLITSDGKIAGQYNGFTAQLVSDVEKSLA